MTYQELLKENRQDIIDFINDARQFTNVTLNAAMQWMVANEDRFNAIYTATEGDKWSSKEYLAFEAMAQEAVSAIYRTPEHMASINAEITADDDQREEELRISKQIHL